MSNKLAITAYKSSLVPTDPGVYIFWRGNEPLYVGKAANLRKRVSSYFRANVSDKVRQLRGEAERLEFVITQSEVEALVTESDLIKRFMPKFNVLMRDDKSYFHVAITREDFPRIFATHQLQKDRIGKMKLTPEQGVEYIGPFTSGSALKDVLMLLRKAFPYCTCKDTQHKRPCLNSQIGRCPGYCCFADTDKEIQKKHKEEYRSNIESTIGILSGRKTKLLVQMKRDMQTAAKQEDFVTAARLRDQIASVENIFAHRPLVSRRPVHIKQNLHWKKIERTIQTLLNTSSPIRRVEGYDISNISGTEATGSMVVFINGKPDKAEYRNFKIKTVDQPNDVAMHREVMRRRLANTDWPRPDLLVIDGGKPQLNAVQKELRPGNPDIHLSALAKREEELFIEGNATPQRLDSLPPEVKFFFQQVRDESHRFAKRYHHKLREISYRNAILNK